MSNHSDIYKKALHQVETRRRTSIEQQDARRARILHRFPRLVDIDSQLAHIGAAAARAAVSGNSESIIADMKSTCDILLGERALILNEAGVDRHYLDIKHECNKCGDTGYVDGKLCDCVKILARAMTFEELNKHAPLDLSDFSSFSLEYYPDTTDSSGINSSKLMTDNYIFALSWAADFNPSSSPSVLFMGPTGLGKTHLSLAMAKSVIDKGYYALYGPVQDFVSAVESERFNRGEGGNTLSSLLECDLLILDDMGTEFNTSFVTSVIYNIINTRILNNRPTIISTNLTLKELEARYSSRIVSRLMGHYSIKLFAGTDIRLMKVNEG